MIDVCISVHENLGELPEVLDSVLSQRSEFGGAGRVFDNGSTDGGPAWVRRRHPDVEVVVTNGACSHATSCIAAVRRFGAMVGNMMVPLVSTLTRSYCTPGSVRVSMSAKSPSHVPCD